MIGVNTYWAAPAARTNLLAVKRMLKARNSGLFLSNKGSWGEQADARLFADVETLMQTALQFEEGDFDMVITVDESCKESDFSLPIPSRHVIQNFRPVQWLDVHRKKAA